MAHSAPNYEEYWPLAAKRWDSLDLQKVQETEVKIVASHLLIHKDAYKGIEKATGVPWYLIAVLHERESGADFTKQLAQGDPLHERSTHEPIAGPFDSFLDSAVWACRHEGFHEVKNWTIERTLYCIEGWNGWGYWLYHPKTPSPYVWASTTVQTAGKYVGDGLWSSISWDHQLGCAALLYQLAKIDRSIVFTREGGTVLPFPVPPAPPKPPAPPVIKPPVPRPVPPPVPPVPWYVHILRWLKW